MIKLNPLLLVCFFVESINAEGRGIGILVAVSNYTLEKFCIGYFPSFAPLPKSIKEAQYHPLVDLSPWAGCDASEAPDDLHGKVVVVSPPNCTLEEKAKFVQDVGGSGVLVVADPSEISPKYQNESVNITVAIISEAHLKQIRDLGPNVTVLQYSPIDGSHMDYSLVVIWFMAMFSIILGACWNRCINCYLSGSNKMAEGTLATPGGRALKHSPSVVYSEEATLNVTPLLIVAFVVCMCGMLLLLYFFYDYLVYFIIAMFCLASTLALYQCIEPFMGLIPYGRCRIPQCKAKCCKQRPEVRQVMLLMGCIAFTVTWLVLRNESYSWVLQDILGIVFTINMLNTLRLPSFKICTVLLVLLFFYDIFFVFVTPLFTATGKSVMVEVATGGSSPELIPMVLKVPHLSWESLPSCYLQYSILGFGDILVPGLLVSYCYKFDVETESRKVYFIAVVIAYGLGLIFTFAGLYFMSQAQPALLYLVPAMLIPVALISFCRKEFQHFWNGRLDTVVDDDADCPDDDQLEEDEDSVESEHNELPPCVGEISSASENASEIGEERSLLR